ncbi:hypothetical protein HKD37_04G009607 [Glycine soja]
MLGCFSMCYIRVVNRTGFLSHGLPMMHKQMCGVLTWQQIAAAIVLCSHYSRPIHALLCSALKMNTTVHFSFWLCTVLVVDTVSHYIATIAGLINLLTCISKRLWKVST